MAHSEEKFFFFLKNKNIAHCFWGEQTHILYFECEDLFRDAKKWDLGLPRTSNGFIKCGINQNRDYGCLTHKLGVVFLSQSVGPLACGCSSFSGIIKGDGTN